MCYSPTDPAVVAAVDPLTLIPGLVEREFQNRVVLQSTAVVQPVPKTLVNIPTKFSTSTAASYDIPITLLGYPVVITATASSYTWQFGDGESQTVSGAGARTTHEYTTNESVTARVDTTWTGTFRVAGGARQTVAGTAQTVGEPVQLQVLKARAVLVSGD